jgi:hypothetical protein
MRIGDMKESKYIKKEDVGRGKLVTIERLEQQNVALEDQPEELKWTAYFKEFSKGMVLNWTNIQLIARALNTEESDEWIGKQVVLFEDPNVSFGGKLIGGIRVREIRTKSKPAPQETPNEEFDDDIPF